MQHAPQHHTAPSTLHPAAPSSMGAAILRGACCLVVLPLCCCCAGAGCWHCCALCAVVPCCVLCATAAAAAAIIAGDSTDDSDREVAPGRAAPALAPTTAPAPAPAADAGSAATAQRKAWVLMRDGWWEEIVTVNNAARTVRHVQSMQFPLDHPDPHLRGKSKGIRLILQERELWPEEGLYLDCALCKKAQKEDPDRKSRSNCCARRLLASQPDFAAQRSLLEETCEHQGVRVIFLPKFHCEMNPIEYLWGFSKRIVRGHCPLRFEDLKRFVYESLASCDLSTIRRFVARFWRFTHAYSQGLEYTLASYAVKKYSGHRRIPLPTRSTQCGATSSPASTHGSKRALRLPLRRLSVRPWQRAAQLPLARLSQWSIPTRMPPPLPCRSVFLHTPYIWLMLVCIARRFLFSLFPMLFSMRFPKCNLFPASETNRHLG
eukprot:m.117949 g.117949  ORF g.117949 m.117949 type:complete len:433 (-) comp9218_c1_seq1:3068-4366(-)